MGAGLPGQVIAHGSKEWKGGGWLRCPELRRACLDAWQWKVFRHPRVFFLHNLDGEQADCPKSSQDRRLRISV